jgi:hypothetical protein
MNDGDFVTILWTIKVDVMGGNEGAMGKPFRRYATRLGYFALSSGYIASAALNSSDLSGVAGSSEPNEIIEVQSNGVLNSDKLLSEGNHDTVCDFICDTLANLLKCARTN